METVILQSMVQLFPRALVHLHSSLGHWFKSVFEKRRSEVCCASICRIGPLTSGCSCRAEQSQFKEVGSQQNICEEYSVQRSKCVQT